MTRYSLMLLLGTLIVAQGPNLAVADCGTCEHSQPEAKDIVDTAVAAGSFKTLAAALEAAGLVETLQGSGPFTVFAPTDKAFSKLPEGTVEELLKPENKAKLAAILTYHVVPGKVLAEDVVKLSEAKTVQGSKVRITVKKGKVRIDDAKVTATDVLCSNGVIHVINRVILPPEKKPDCKKAQGMIRAAVFVGSHLYNAGHPAACASLYQHTARRVMAISPSPLNDEDREHLQAAMEGCNDSDCTDSRAWAMRRALDRAYASLAN